LGSLLFVNCQVARFTYNLFINHSDILDIYTKAYKYILVDEYQDTTPIQFALLDLLVRGDAESTGGSPVFIFGDDWQSIYGFLGAVPENHMEKAKSVFGCSVVELTHDHRVSSPALSLLGKALRDTSGKPDDLDESTTPLYVLETPTEMADRVDNIVNEWTEAEIPLHDIAILARHRWQLEGVQEALSFDYLNVPDLQANQIEDNAVFKVLMNLAEGRAAARSLRRHLINHTQQADVSKGERYIRQILVALAGNYDLRFKDLKISERARLMANEALLEINWGQQLRGYCQDRIFTGTLHSAKGLEFRAVAIVHLDCDSFPYWRFVCKHCKKGRSVESRLQEEWRVFYVGVTRASEHLALFSSANNRWGYSTPLSCLIEPRIQSHLRIHDNRGEESAEQSLTCEYRQHRNVLSSVEPQ
jgi:superfamily I DNA/RNA helicase